VGSAGPALRGGDSQVSRASIIDDVAGILVGPNNDWPSVSNLIIVDDIDVDVIGVFLL